MFFDDRKGGGGIAGAILTSNKDGTLTNKPKEEASAPDHELLVQELHDAVHGRDTQGTYDAMHALFAHFRANEGAGE